MQISDSVDLILLFPIKLCTLKGSLIVSDLTVDYLSVQKSKLQSLSKNILIESSIKPLEKTSETIMTDIIQQQDLFRFFQKYLKLDLQIEKSEQDTWQNSPGKCNPSK